MVGYCRNCGAPLPPNAPANRKYCLPVEGRTPCRIIWHRRKRSEYIKEARKKEELIANPMDERFKENPVSLPEDLLSLSQREIIAISAPPSVIVALLKAKLELEIKEKELLAMKDAQSIKEETHLDPELRRKAARILARENKPQGTSSC